MPAPHAPVEIREFPEPDLPPGGALLRTARSEVCGTDVHLWHGRLSGVPYPIIPGHVTTGTLDAIRGPLTRHSTAAPLREGDRVAFFDVHRTCGRCLACTVHRTPTRCPSRRVYGITDSAAEGLFGGWAQKVYLEPGVVVAKLPDARLVRRVHRRRLRPADGRAHHRARAPARSATRWSSRAPAPSGSERGRARAQVRRGAGHRHRRARRPARAGAANGRRRGDRSRRDDARRAAASACCDAHRRARRRRRRRSRRIARARSRRACRFARNGGAYVIAGHYTNAGDSTINAHEHINRKHLDIRGCWGSEVGHFLRALDALERHGATCRGTAIGARTYGLAPINDALETAGALRSRRRSSIRGWTSERGRDSHAPHRALLFATLGPASTDAATIRALHRRRRRRVPAELLARHDGRHAATCQRDARGGSGRGDREIAVLQDLGGPEDPHGPARRAVSARATATTLVIDAGRRRRRPGPDLMLASTRSSHPSRPASVCCSTTGGSSWRSRASRQRDLTTRVVDRRPARRAQGHQPARRAAADVGADAEGPSRTCAPASRWASISWR